MIWLIYTLVSKGVVVDVDHKTFKSYTECAIYADSLHAIKPKMCFTQYAKFKQPKKVK